jgi:hypothetical protein
MSGETNLSMLFMVVGVLLSSGVLGVSVASWHL